VLLTVAVVVLSGCATGRDNEMVSQEQEPKIVYHLILQEVAPRQKLVSDDLQGQGLDPNDRKTVGGGGSSVRGGVIEPSRPIRVRADTGTKRLRARQRYLLSREAILDRRLYSLDRDLRGSILRRSASFQPNRARRAELTRPRLELERRAVESEIQAIQRNLKRAIFEERTRRGGFGGGSPLQSQLDRLRRRP